MLACMRASVDMHRHVWMHKYAKTHACRYVDTHTHRHAHIDMHIGQSEPVLLRWTLTVSPVACEKQCRYKSTATVDLSILAKPSLDVQVPSVDRQAVCSWV